MVKGISRQVIMVHSPDPKLFDQAIFILKDDAVGNEGITEELLLKEATKLIGQRQAHKRRSNALFCIAWACCGALATGVLWLFSSFL